MEIVVGFAPGGGNDRTARTLGRILGTTRSWHERFLGTSRRHAPRSLYYVKQRRATPYPEVFGGTMLTITSPGRARSHTDFTTIASLFMIQVYAWPGSQLDRQGPDRPLKSRPILRRPVAAIGAPGHLPQDALQGDRGTRRIEGGRFKSSPTLTPCLGGFELTRRPQHRIRTCRALGACLRWLPEAARGALSPYTRAGAGRGPGVRPWRAIPRRADDPCAVAMGGARARPSRTRNEERPRRPRSRNFATALSSGRSSRRTTLTRSGDHGPRWRKMIPPLLQICVHSCIQLDGAHHVAQRPREPRRERVQVTK